MRNIRVFLNKQLYFFLFSYAMEYLFIPYSISSWNTKDFSVSIFSEVFLLWVLLLLVQTSQQHRKVDHVLHFNILSILFHFIKVVLSISILNFISILQPMQLLTECPTYSRCTCLFDVYESYYSQFNIHVTATYHHWDWFFSLIDKCCYFLLSSDLTGFGASYHLSSYLILLSVHRLI